jgi:hypothetical protein
MIWNPWKALRIEQEENVALRHDMIRQVSQLYDDLEAAHLDCVKLEDALRLVIDQEKPTSNSTVKRMANIAREGLFG